MPVAKLRTQEILGSWQAARCQDVQTVVRYNQRGVGSSSGSTSLWGAQDMADATALCQHILSMHNGPTHLHLVGYSWGACVAAHASQLQQITAFVGISPVTGGLASFFLRTKRHLSQLPPILPKMLILGDRDQFSSVSSLQKVFGSEQSSRKLQDLAVPQTEHIPACFVLMTDCDHFYINERKEMAEKVLQFCCKQFATQTKL